MELEQYEVMARRESRHWWYAGMRRVALAVLSQALGNRTDARILDAGCGAGFVTITLARALPEAEVVGVDLSERMLAEARRKTPPEVVSRVRFEQADASKLPFPDQSFDLVGLANMIPFFDELARLVAPGGSVVFSFSAGPETPIYVPSERLREELSRRGFTQFADFQVDAGTSFLARKGEPG
jgi:ubiquinone/menaquinone biosynthesis C-methylase UbiE